MCSANASSPAVSFIHGKNRAKSRASETSWCDNGLHGCRCVFHVNREIRPDAKYMSPKQAAAHYGVSLNTIMRWINAGKLEALQPAGRYGRLLIPR